MWLILKEKEILQKNIEVRRVNQFTLSIWSILLEVNNIKSTTAKLNIAVLNPKSLKNSNINKNSKTISLYQIIPILIKCSPTRIGILQYNHNISQF